MLVTLSGMLMLVSDLHPENALFPMLVTLFGILTLAREEQSSNAVYPMLVTLFGMLMLVNDLHLENAEFPMLVTLSGMLYDSSSALYAIIMVLSALNKTLSSYMNDFDSILKEPFQPANGFPSILITLSGILMLVRESHHKNASFPILVTLFGMLMLVRE